jgi:hypothetical protein
VSAGTDRSNTIFLIIASGFTAVVLFAAVARFLQARHKRLTAAA